ncbi:MAG: hypothetical protein ACE5I1_17595, partial [bacterium]
MKKQSLIVASLLFLAISCAPRTPLEKLKRDMNRFPEYSIILEDMREDGNFFKDYFHKYKLVHGEKTNAGDTLTYQTEIT